MFKRLLFKIRKKLGKLKTHEQITEWPSGLYARNDMSRSNEILMELLMYIETNEGGIEHIIDHLKRINVFLHSDDHKTMVSAYNGYKKSREKRDLENKEKENTKILARVAWDKLSPTEQKAVKLHYSKD